MCGGGVVQDRCKGLREELLPTTRNNTRNLVHFVLQQLNITAIVHKKCMQYALKA